MSNWYVNLPNPNRGLTSLGHFARVSYKLESLWTSGNLLEKDSSLRDRSSIWTSRGVGSRHAATLTQSAMWAQRFYPDG